MARGQQCSGNGQNQISQRWGTDGGGMGNIEKSCGKDMQAGIEMLEVGLRGDTCNSQVAELRQLWRRE